MDHFLHDGPPLPKNNAASLVARGGEELPGVVRRRSAIAPSKRTRSLSDSGSLRQARRRLDQGRLLHLDQFQEIHTYPDRAPRRGRGRKMKAKKVVAIDGLATSGCGVALPIGRLSASRWADRVVGDHYHPIGPARGMRRRPGFL